MKRCYARERGTSDRTCQPECSEMKRSVSEECSDEENEAPATT